MTISEPKQIMVRALFRGAFQITDWGKTPVKIDSAMALVEEMA